MSTKSEQFRSETQRAARTSRTARAASTDAPPRRTKGQLPPDENDATPTVGAKQRGTHTQKRASVKVEVSETGKTSRKSTRASANRSKGAAPLTLAASRKTRSAKTRAGKAEAARATHAGARKI